MERFSKTFEEQYIQLGMDILRHGKKIPTRTGIDCITLDHGYMFIPAGVMPMLVGKKLYPKMALKEIVWFMLGRNDVQWLRNHGVTYWDEWEIKSSERAKQLNLDDSWIGTIGKSYGYQWRNFGSTGTNQFHNLLENITKDPFSRRHIISSWCPSEYHQMALPPCVYDWNVQILPANILGYGNTYSVHIHAKARSIDYFLGLPYDMLQAYWFQKILIDILNLQQKANRNSGAIYSPGNIHFNIDNFHVYENHVDKVYEYIQSATKKINNCNIRPFTESHFIREKVAALNIGRPQDYEFNLVMFVDEYLNNFDFSDIDIHHHGYSWKDLPVIKADVAI